MNTTDFTPTGLHVPTIHAIRRVLALSHAEDAPAMIAIDHVLAENDPVPEGWWYNPVTRAAHPNDAMTRIKAVRARTGASLKSAKDAIEASNWDVEAAVKSLRGGR